METGRFCRDHPRYTGAHLSCPRAREHTFPLPPHLRDADSAPLLRGQPREGAEELLPSRTLGGDSLGTEAWTHSVSFMLLAFPRHPSASHSHPFITSSGMLAPDPVPLWGTAARAPFLQGPADSMPRTVQTFSGTSLLAGHNGQAGSSPSRGCFTCIVPIA